MKRLVNSFAGIIGSATLFLATLLSSAAALAQEALPDQALSHNWQLGLPPAESPVAVSGHHFWNLLLILSVAITGLVLVLLSYVIVRFRAKANPVPSKVSHNTLIEMIWTVVPVIILLIIFVPSMRFLYYTDRSVDAQMTIKATGNQWFWSYQYPDEGFEFVSNLVPDEDLKPGQHRLLEVDEPIVVPVGTKVRVQTTSVDVVHSWAVPSFFVKIDAVPGRLNETWFEADKIGVYHGQCSELCGIRHGFMPIVVHVVSKDDYNQWVQRMKKEYGSIETPSKTVKLASAEDGATRVPVQ